MNSSLELFLGRGEGDRCTLTLLRPYLARVLGVGPKEVYCQVEDAVLQKDLCLDMVRKQFGVVPGPCQVHRVKLKGEDLGLTKWENADDLVVTRSDPAR